MVSLEEKVTYLAQVKANPKLHSFHDFLYGKTIAAPSTNTIEVDEIYYGILVAILHRKKNDFQNLYARISKRMVDKDSPSPFIYDDGLIFSIIVGVKLFGVDKTWVVNVVSVRSMSPLTTTFIHLLEEDFLSKSNLPEVVIPFLELTQQLSGHEQILDNAYVKISSDIDLYSNTNDFVIIMTLRSFDVIVQSKSSHAGDFERLKAFEGKFVTRVWYLSIALYNILLFAFIYGCIKGLTLFPAFKDRLNDFALLISVIGTSFSNLFSFFKDKMKLMIWGLLGYTKHLEK
jgi:hypothetical protein